MAFIEQLKSVFKKKTEDAGQDSRLSIGMPDVSMFQEDSDLVPHMTRQTAATQLTPGGSEGDSYQIVLPFLGSKTVAQHQRVLSISLGATLILLVAATLVGFNESDEGTQQLSVAGQSLMQSQRLAKSVSQALVGDVKAFPDVAESAQILTRSVRALIKGDPELRLEALDASYQPVLDRVSPLVDRAEKNAAVVMTQQKVLTEAGAALRLINQQSAELLGMAESVATLKLQQNAPAAEISAAGQLVMLTQRIGKTSNEFLTSVGVSPAAVTLLGKDLNSFKDIAQGLLTGSAELRLVGSADAETRDKLTALIKQFDETRTQAGAILGNSQGLVSARAAQASILADREVLRK